MAFAKWTTYGGDQLYRDASGAYTYVTRRMELDADGSPRAYHPDGKSGLDALANAGYPSKGWRSVLVVDPADSSKAYVQSAGATKGFFVSKTSLYDHAAAATDPAAYVNSECVPYIVFPGNFYALKGTGAYGDLAMARNLDNAKETFAIVADGGPASAALGEVSLALATALGGTNPNPRNGAGSPKGRFQYLIFPKSRATPAWPRTNAEMDSAARKLLANVGGWPAI
jgi:hypothetical protein